jgi:hypothetical protein
MQQCTSSPILTLKTSLPFDRRSINSLTVAKPLKAGREQEKKEVV